MNDFFKERPYPGRFMVIGIDRGSVVVLYGATGRSPASLKRRFVEQGDGVYMTAVDATVTLEGVPELLEYPAVRFFDNGVIVSNGNHIEGIESLDASLSARDNLAAKLDSATYEPDEYKTPRITGCIIQKDGALSAALHIARAMAPDVERAYFDTPLSEGVGSYISTYTGVDVRPTPSFSGAPLPFPVSFGSAEKAAEALYAMLAPRDGGADYRIGVIAVYWKPGAEAEFSIKNRLI